MSATPAFALRTYETPLNGPPPIAPKPGPFSRPSAIFVDGGDNVWVSDLGNEGVTTKFSSTGAYLLQRDGGGHYEYNGEYIQSIAVLESTGEFFAADSGPVKLDVYDSGGNFLSQQSGEWGGYVYVAVDNSGGPATGSVYTAGRFDHIVYKTNAAGSPVNYAGPAGYINGDKLIGPSAEQPFGQIVNVSTDAEGNIYVVDQEREVVDVFNSSGIFQRELSSTPEGSFGSVEGASADPTNGSIFVVDAGEGVVHEFDLTGAFLSDLTGPEGEHFSNQIRGVGVDSTGHVYVADEGNHRVFKISPDVVVPKVTYPAVTGLSRTSVTLNARIDPNEGGDVTTCSFDYGLTASYEATKSCTPDPAGSPPDSNFAGPADVSASITALTPETVYHYRVVAGNANGTKFGSDQTFKTPSAVQSVSTEDPTEVTQTAATLNGSFVGDGSETHYHFEWGESTSYGHTTTTPPGASPSGLMKVSASISGLEVYTPVSPTYHYRLVATNGLGTTYGPDKLFHTSPPFLPAVRETHGVADTPEGANVGAEINPGFGDTIYFFQWGTDTSYGSESIPGESIGSDNTDHAVVGQLSGLTPATLYHYRAVAVNFAGTTYGEDEVVLTPGAPGVDTIAASAVGTGTATLEAQVRPNSAPTTFTFEYGATEALGATTAPGGIGGDSSAHRVTTSLAGLSSATTYFVRVVAVNMFGTTRSAIQTFTTATQASGPAGGPEAGTCKVGFVKRHGKCVKKRHHRKSRHRHHRKHRGGEDK